VSGIVATTTPFLVDLLDQALQNLSGTVLAHSGSLRIVGNLSNLVNELRLTDNLEKFIDLQKLSDNGAGIQVFIVDPIVFFGIFTDQLIDDFGNNLRLFSFHLACKLVLEV
jgi:hypothetical protein